MRRIGRGNRLVDLLWRAQGARCFHCGAPMARCTEQRTPRRWTREHLWPRARSDSGRNEVIVLAHRSCNAERGDRLPTLDEIRRATALYRAIDRVFDPAGIRVADLPPGTDPNYFPEPPNPAAGGREAA